MILTDEPETRVAVEVRKRTVRPHERFLYDVIRVIMRLHKAACEEIHPLLVLQHDAVEGFIGASGLKQLDKFGVGI